MHGTKMNQNCVLQRTVIFRNDAYGYIDVSCRHTRCLLMQKIEKQIARSGRIDHHMNHNCE